MSARQPTEVDDEWRALGHAMRTEDPAIHDETLRMVRGIVGALQRRRARRGAAAPGAAS